MPSRQSSRLKRAALKYAEMTPAELAKLTPEQALRYEAMSREWRQYEEAHPRSGNDVALRGRRKVA